MSDACARAGRDPQTATLVAVTKAVDPDAARVLYDEGVRHFGENRLESAAAKIEALPSDAVWHMIAPIQRRKTKDIASMFQWADALDRLKAAESLERSLVDQDRCIKGFVEVNVSGEESKHGFAPEDLAEALDAMRACGHIEIRGLMTMAPFREDPEEVRPLFARLRALAAEHHLPDLSMGMSNDYAVALEEGATQVRIGTELFRED
jgi:hypothetical protein